MSEENVPLSQLPVNKSNNNWPSARASKIKTSEKDTEVSDSHIHSSPVTELSPAAKVEMPGILLIASQSSGTQVTNFDMNQPGKLLP